MQSCLLFDLVLLRPLPLTSSTLLSSLTLLLQLGKQSMLLFTQARPIPLLLSKLLEASSPITLIAPSTSGTAQARLSGPFTSWHTKTLPVPRLLLDAIQLLCLTLFDPRVLLPVSTHGEHPLLVHHLRVVTSFLSKVVSRTFSSPLMLKVGAGFHLLASRSPCVPGRLEPSLTMLPLGSSDSAFSCRVHPLSVWPLPGGNTSTYLCQLLPVCPLSLD